MRLISTSPHPYLASRTEVFVVDNPYPIGHFDVRRANEIYAYSARTKRNTIVLDRAAAIAFIKAQMYSVWKIRK